MKKKSSTLAKLSTRDAGVLQGLSVALYVALFVVTVRFLGDLIVSPPPALAGIMALLALVVSALICGSLVFGYPVVLAMSGRVRRAVETVAWSAFTLVLVALLVLTTLIASSL